MTDPLRCAASLAPRPTTPLLARLHRRAHVLFVAFIASLLAGLVGLGTPAVSWAQIENRSQLVSAMDSAGQAYAADSAVAGVSVGVLHKGDTLLLEGYGRADLELDAPTPPDAVYEVGSITKQFTAAAILQLAGKDSIDLDAPITGYLPDYNTRGRAITVRHLLYHTSGIRNYIPHMTSARTLVKAEAPRDSLLSVLGAEPLRFAPGTAMVYSNSGYFLLGYIIEAASGRSYEDYLETRLLAPAGMEASHYCDRDLVVKSRAHGYQWTEEGFTRETFWTPTWVDAAGALCSTAPDLLAWNQALHGGEILPDSLYREMIRPGRLADGTELRYGMGLLVYKRRGRPFIAHGGRMSGYRSHLRYYPEDSLTVVVLQNTSTGPQQPGSLANALARLALGPGEAPDSSRYDGDLTEFAGRYSGPGPDELMTLEVEAKGGRLLVRKIGSGASADTLTYQSGSTWRDMHERFKLAEHYRFIRAGEQVTQLRLDQGYGHYVLRRLGKR